MSLKPIITKTGRYNSTIRNQIKRLNDLTGSTETAFKFNPNHTKLQMYIHHHPSPPASGLKQFFNSILPTLRFHNPEFQYEINSVMVDESQINKVPLKLTLVGDNPVEINCKDKSASEILKELVEKGNLTRVDEKDIPKIAMNPETKENRYLK